MNMSGNVIELSDATFEQEVLQSEGVVLVDFWAPWCGPCKALTPTIEEIENERAGKNKICKMNVDDNPETAVKYNVRGIPTMIFFKDGQITNQISGVYPKDHIENVLDNA